MQPNTEGSGAKKRQRSQRDGAAASKRERSNEAARPTHRALHNATACWWTGLPRLRLQREGKMVVPFGWTRRSKRRSSGAFGGGLRAP